MKFSWCFCNWGWNLRWTLEKEWIVWRGIRRCHNPRTVARIRRIKRSVFWHFKSKAIGRAWMRLHKVFSRIRRQATGRPDTLFAVLSECRSVWPEYQTPAVCMCYTVCATERTHTHFFCEKDEIDMKIHMWKYHKWRAVRLYELKSF